MFKKIILLFFRREYEINEMKKIQSFNRKRDIENRVKRREKEESEKRKREILQYKMRRDQQNLIERIQTKFQQNEKNIKELEMLMRKRECEKSIYIQNVRKKKDSERRKQEIQIEYKKMKVKENKDKIERQFIILAEQRKENVNRRHARSEKIANKYLKSKNDFYKRYFKSKYFLKIL